MAFEGCTRVLYSFPHKIGATRICHTAYQLVKNVSAAGADVLLFPGAVQQRLPANVRTIPTLAKWKLRLPYRVLGTVKSLQLHDYIVSRRLEKLAGQVDVVHTWPVGALRTLRTAARLGITTVLERPNAYTRFAYEVVAKECARLGVVMPANHEHAFHADILQIEEAEYATADFLLCPSDFVLQTFLEAGFPRQKLLRHQYGFDHELFAPGPKKDDDDLSLRMLFVGGVAPRKGLHYALEAWLMSPACKNGVFSVAGAFIPGYAEKMKDMLSHPSVRILGHRTDVAQLMRAHDVFVLPSIEEGSALVTSEARGSGCVLLVSEATGAVCKHMENALVHKVGDVVALSRHITDLFENRALLNRLRATSIETIHEATWSAAGHRLLRAYQEALTRKMDVAQSHASR